jgi:hypothetical protein
MLVDSVLAASILAALQGGQGGNTQAQVAAALAAAIDAQIKTATVTINLGSTANGVTVGGANVPVTGTATIT